MKRLVLAMLLAMPALANAQDPAPPKETDEQKFVRLTRALEARPWTAGDPDTGWLVRWAIDTPDHHVLICPMAGDDWKLGDPLGTPLMMAVMVGNMAWQLERDGQDADELSKQYAGVLTALRIYANTIARDPSKRSTYFDALVARRDAGTLRDYLAPLVAEHCAVKQPDPDAKPAFLGGFLRETDIVYPLRIGAWEWVGEHRYEQQEAGVSARYVRKGEDTDWIDVFFYPVGTLDAEEAARLAELERQGLAAPDAALSPRDMSALSTFDIPLPSAGNAPASVMGRIVDFATTYKEKPRHSSMAIAVHHLYAVKMRYTVDAGRETREQARTILQDFARGLLSGTEFDSTGNCWSPSKPIAGCNAPKDLLRAAPEGKRILHIDYAAPATEGPPAQPMRVERSGVG